MSRFTDNLNEQDLKVSEHVASFHTFVSMEIKLELLKGIYKSGLEKPSLIQQKAIRPIIDGRDVIAQAQSGTGKTATFCIGVLQNIQQHQSRLLQALILAPTRELAQQIHQVMSSLSDYLPIRCVACCGGRSDVVLMDRELSKGAHVVVGTPGRVLDLIRQGSLRLDSLRSFVLDEADEMLNRGLHGQLEAIFNRLPRNSDQPVLGANIVSDLQVVIVSATLPQEHLDVIRKFTRDPVHILVPKDELSLSGLQQFYIDVAEEEWKFEALGDLFASVCVPQTVVFVNTRRKVDWLASQLRRSSFTVEAVHGEMDQKARESVMNGFRSGTSRILVSSDIWARGIDVQNVGLVVNYDLPATSSDYLHRIGRSGRFGRRGLAVSLLAGADDRKRLSAIARYYHIVIPPAPNALEKMLTNSTIKNDGSSEPQPVGQQQIIDSKSQRRPLQESADGKKKRKNKRKRRKTK